MDWETLAALSKADADNQAALEESTVAQVQAAYDGLDWYDHEAITAAAAGAGAAVHSASRTAASFTSAYLTRAIGETAGSAPRGRTLSIVDPLRMEVASWATAYGRVADTVRFEVSKGKPLADAVALGLQRADATTRIDLGLARRAQARTSFTGSTAVIGYRRVVHPELSRSGSCGLCVAAADRVYHREALMPIHHRCKCTTLPVTAAHDPGSPWDMDDAFAETYRLSASTSARDLKETRVAYEVDEHGELGPVLVSRQRSANPGRNRAAREARGLAPVQRPDTQAASQTELAAARRLRNQTARQTARV
ncbi:hypothetical protein [Isoptericola sp. NPDC056605]|uniref:hypothetical protein n=1 Tax=Isoptericola sp. NPDC056605 TaxID=3345876 RepID=UPI0036BA3D7F